MEKNFWKNKPLSEFNEEEWEATCMRCGKCCLNKDYDKKNAYFSNHMCENYDFSTGKCRCYPTRVSSTCAKVDLKLIMTQPELLPPTCAYRLLFEGKDLPAYHPLVSGNPNSAHAAGKTAMEMEGVYSIGLLGQALFDVNKRAFDEKWSEEKFTKEEAAVFRKYKRIYLEVYPLPSADQYPNSYHH